MNLLTDHKLTFGFNALACLFAGAQNSRPSLPAFMTNPGQEDN
ncbi:MAG: hypothetical protein QNJ40_20320 [Xanthomonadales bacterium]|nr:hypothetical protein [Xanthomonadales bacterium]